jgi:hypothetical protein
MVWWPATVELLAAHDDASRGARRKDGAAVVDGRKERNGGLGFL